MAKRQNTPHEFQGNCHNQGQALTDVIGVDGETASHCFKKNSVGHINPGEWPRGTGRPSNWQGPNGYQRLGYGDALNNDYHRLPEERISTLAKLGGLYRGHFEGYFW